MNIEGKNAVKECLSANDGKVSTIYIQQGLHDMQKIVDMAKSLGIRYEFVPKSTLDKMSETGRHQGLIAECSEYEYSSVDDIIATAHKKNEKLLMLLLDGIEDPHNLGSILRVAECAGVHGVVIPKHRSCEITPTVVKVSAGAIAHIKVAKVTNINDTIRELKDKFINVVCADMDGKNIYSCDLKGDYAIVVGGEGQGVKPLTRKLCDMAISIPQYGMVNSLNASVACGVVVFEAVRQRNI